MIRVRFLGADGEHAREVMAEPGECLLTVGQNDGQPLEGTCEGQMACSTKLPRAREEEEDMLDLAAGATRTSRLACQIMLTEALDGLTVRIPVESRNMQGR
jgi:ferredoxin-2, mitochondrial